MIKYNKLIIKIIFILLLLLLYVCVCAFSYANSIVNDISDSVFRLHVIANSDSLIDQDLKLKVRDSLLKYMNSISKNVSSKTDAVKIAKSHINDFKEIATTVIHENGYNYSIDISIDKCNFPTKKYGDISLPAGNYDALRVKIGNATGHNWWCVMFPPLCFVDVSSGIVPDESKSILKDNMSSQDYDLITASNNSNVNFKFKIFELVNNFKNNIDKN